MDTTLSNSRLTLFRRCPRMYYWRYVYGIEPIRPSHAIVLGDMAHTAFEYFHNIKSDHGEVLLQLQAMGKGIVDAAPSEEKEELFILSRTAQAMWEFIPKWFLDNKNTTRAEQHFVVELFSNDQHRILYQGYIDRLVKKEHLLIRELKTCISPDMFIRAAAVSSQASGYVLGVNECLKQPVAGITYDLIRKPSLRKRQNEDMQQFADRIRADYRDRPEWYYRRDYTYRTDKQTAEFKIDLASVGVSVLAAEIEFLSSKNPNTFWRNHDQCFSRGECQYYKVCFNYDDMTEKIFYKKTDAEVSKGEAEDIEE